MYAEVLPSHKKNKVAELQELDSSKVQDVCVCMCVWGNEYHIVGYFLRYKLTQKRRKSRFRILRDLKFNYSVYK